MMSMLTGDDPGERVEEFGENWSVIGVFGV